MLGMYVHTHWAYNHPYAARTWTLEDWEGYLDSLSRLGYDVVMVWPQLDSMPVAPTDSDRAYLRRLSQVIDIAHARHGMQVIITLCPNTIGNDEAAGYAFERRPYFVCERKINPADEREVTQFLAGRCTQLALLANADAVAIIDSDPGGYIGSTNAQFVELVAAQVEMLRSYNPSAEFVYWMLAGWENYNRFWAEARDDPSGEADMWRDRGDEGFSETLTLMQRRIMEPWWVFGWLDPHLQALQYTGLAHKAMFYPYGAIEGEPTFPLTNCDPRAVAEAISVEQAQRCPLGLMANAQTHCLQLPHTYTVAHIAGGGTVETLDLEAFAERLIPEHASLISQAWDTLEAGSPADRERLARELRDAAGPKNETGDLRGLLFGSPSRFLVDLALNLDLRAKLRAFSDATDEGRDERTALASLLETLRPYRSRVGFADAYGGPLHSLFNVPLARLGDPRIQETLDQFSDWRNPQFRNGLLLRLLDAAQRYVAEGNG